MYVLMHYQAIKKPPARLIKRNGRTACNRIKKQSAGLPAFVIARKTHPIKLLKKYTQSKSCLHSFVYVLPGTFQGLKKRKTSRAFLILSSIFKSTACIICCIIQALYF